MHEFVVDAQWHEIDGDIADGSFAALEALVAEGLLPAKDFGLPEKARTSEAKQDTGNYPMPDRGHAISAKRLARKNRKDGNLTKDQFDRINRKADKVLHEDKA